MPVRDEILEPVRRVLGWMLRQADGEGRIVCPAHGVEHTGKSAGVIVLAAELLRLDPQRDAERLLDAAVLVARRLVANLQREGTSPCHTFRPGRHDPFNCSNHVIDGGACSDALAHLVTELGERLDAKDREAFANASVLHARTYLRYAVLDKGIPAQRGWGLTGLAGAARLVDDPELERAAAEAVGVLEAIQHPDGSYPYHPLEWGAGHVGASDVSSFYQSRVTGFLLYALERMGRSPNDALFRTPLQRGLEFLLALQGPDGIKCGLVEAKPWYWGATYEVASHPFDVYALSAGWRHFRNSRLALGARAAFRAWAAHLTDEGEPQSHLPGPGRERSYQCPLFWAGHALWMARSLEALEASWQVGAEPETPPGDGARQGIELGVRWFPNAQLGRLDDARVAAWVRGARPGFNVHHGSPHGAGLLRVYDRRERRELIERCRLGGSQEAEWSGQAGLPSLTRGLRSGGSELRFSLWLARVAARAGRTGEAWSTPARVLKRGVLAFAAPRVASAFHLAPEVDVLGDGLHLSSGLARRDGSPLAGSRVERTFRIDGEGLEVEERCTGEGGARGLRYVVPRAATAVDERPGEVRYRLG